MEVSRLEGSQPQVWELIQPLCSGDYKVEAREVGGVKELICLQMTG